MSAAEQRNPEHEQVRRMAHWLDNAFRVPGTSRRFGVDAVVGMVPGIGDVAGLVLSATVVANAVRLGARGATVVRMVLNVAVDAVVGTIPVVGWLFDFVFKANIRNVALLERHTLDPEATRAESRTAVVRTLVGLGATVVVLVVAIVALLVGLVLLVV